MWRLLPIILLVSCATTDPGGTAPEAKQADTFRIISTLELPLTSMANTDAGQPLAKEFRGRETRGKIINTGAWNFRHLVTHTRLRCATYQTGLQLGRGNPACTEVKWTTGVDYGSSRTHCNSAPMIHNPTGEMSVVADTLEQATCVRIITRCMGPC